MRQGQFWAIPKEVMEMIGLPLEARIIFGIFWTRQNGDNVAWPGQQYIADIIGCSIRSVHRHTSRLVEAGLIIVHQQGLRRTNRYEIVDNQWIRRSRTGQIGRSLCKRFRSKRRDERFRSGF